MKKASESIDELTAQLNDGGFEFTSQPPLIAFFAAFRYRVGTMKQELDDWKELFWQTAYDRPGD